MNRSTIVLILISFFFLSLTSNLNLVDARGDPKPEAGGTGASINLTKEDFDSKVTESGDLWLIEFSTPWCGYSKQLKPEWEKAAKNLEGKVKFGSVQCDEQPDLRNRFPITGFPTILEFALDKKNPVAYLGGRTAAEIEQFAMTELNAINAKKQ